jgi:periplasmic protein CpxP/Spy
MMDPTQQLSGMTKRYNLSADQQNQVKPILADQQQQIQLLHLDSSLSPDEKKAKMQSIRSDSNTKIEAILNDDQKKQFEQDHQSTQERMQQRRQGGGPDGGGPPPQQ